MIYLFHRKMNESTDGYLKKAMGPYDHKLKYSIEKIAETSGYIKRVASGKGRSYISGKNINQAKEYFDRWYDTKIVEWLNQFRYTKNNELEVLTTVDMAMVELEENDKEITVSSIKDVIKSSKEWKPKLEKDFFSDIAIKAAMERCVDLFK